MPAKDPIAVALAARLAELHPGWGLAIEPPPIGPSRGAVRQREGSGLVRYVYAADDRGRYLEFYSFHRIWGDSYARIYESGDVEHLPTLQTMLPVTGDPDEDARARDEQNKANQELLRRLDDAGLLSGGPVPMSFQINSAIVTGAIDADAPEPER
ncbi:MAG: hypothetical protein ABR575_11025 [Actinomycetota bacterium]